MLHWDGKLLPNITGREKVERLPILVSQDKNEQLLGVPKLKNGTGAEIASAVFDEISGWELLEHIQAICFDTTASNTGPFKGASALLEQKLGRQLLYLPCRHHIMELILRAVFELKLTKSPSPNVSLFERFKAQWKDLEQHEISPGIDDPYVAKRINLATRSKITQFCEHQLSKEICRSDYREFLELILMFLGEKVPNRSKLRPPGPTHHARWMGKGIYSLKTFLLRNHFQWKDANEKNGVRDVCIFLVLFYVNVWFSCSIGAEAPNNDLNLLKDGIAYTAVDPAVSRTILAKFRNHLWYLSQEAVGLAFFDANVSTGEKTKMVESLCLGESSDDNDEDDDEYDGEVIVPKRITATAAQIRKSYKSKKLSSFVTPNTMKFFKRFGISTDFLKFDPNTWEFRDDYNAGVEICYNIRVVNDIAERGVKLITEFNQILTNDEQMKQFLLQVVAEYRKQYSSCGKNQLLDD